MEKFEIYTSDESESKELQKYEIVGITTDSRTFIANGVLTHNKGTEACDDFFYSSTSVNKTINVEYTYGTANPNIVVTCTLISRAKCQYSYYQVNDGAGNQMPAGNGTKAISISMPNPNPLTYLSTKTVQLVLTNTGTDGYKNYTASLTATDSAGRVAQTSTALRGANNTCLVPETIIEKFDGSFVSLRELQIGDEIKTIDLQNMRIEKTTITDKIVDYSDILYKINEGLITCTKSHIHVVKRGDDWKTLQSDKLLLGDSYLTKGFELVEINKIEIIS